MIPPHYLYTLSGCFITVITIITCIFYNSLEYRVLPYKYIDILKKILGKEALVEETPFEESLFPGSTCRIKHMQSCELRPSSLKVDRFIT